MENFKDKWMRKEGESGLPALAGMDPREIMISEHLE